MKWFLKLFFICSFISANSQNQANIWYFGDNAGLDFNSGMPVPILDGAIVTDEGCASISSNTGDLLFYTDGSTAYNRNHLVMANGTGLNGNFSSTHSAIIVPKPGSTSLYYIFTVDAIAGPNGLQYSEVDMSLDGGLGSITASKNILLFTPTTEKISAVKGANPDEFWVVSHKWNSNEFIAYRINSAGVNTTPVISNVGTIIDGPLESEAIGQIKISPDGTKIAVARSEGLSEVQLFDFNTTTGSVSNPLTVLDLADDQLVYGVEFSPNSNLLYTSVAGLAVFQYNLEAGSPSDIINSQFELTSLPRGYAGMQLGPDGKLYIAKPTKFEIDVIDNPNIIGAGANYQFESLSLNGRRSRLGLPPFIQSFFSVGFTYENLCAGNTTQFNSNISESYDSLLWDFGDANTSIDENPSHTYATAGTYTVTLEVTSGGQTATETQEVVINEQPMANTPSNLTSCDTNNDGFLSFNLTQVENEVLNGQNTSLFDFTYFASLTDFNNNTPISNPTSYQNLTPFTPQEVFVNIYNNQNSGCVDTTSFTIQPFYSPNPAATIPLLDSCDNTTAGTDTDGQIIFDLTVQESFLYNGVPTSELTFTYFQDNGLTMPIPNTASYTNTNAQETIFVQLINPNNPSCEVVTSFNIEVYALPQVQNLVVLSQCDDDTDGFSIFNLEEVINEITANAASETITFHESEQQAIDNLSPIGNPTAYQNQVVSTDQVWARIENNNTCFRTSEVQLLVSTTQIPLDFTRAFYECDDAIDGDTTDGISTFNFSSVTQEIEALFPIGQQLVITYYQTLADALSEVNAIPDISNYRNIASPNTQDIYIRVDSLLDNDCLGLGEHITLFVETVPIANPVTIDTLCDTDGDGQADFDTSTIENDLLLGQTGMTVTYQDALGNPLPSPLPNPFTTASQNITATITNASSQDPNGPCIDQTIISFQVEAAAMANPIPEQRNCDDDDDGIFNFDITGIEAAILNGQTGMNVIYTAQDGSILPSPLPNPFTTASQDITVRVENQLSSACFDETTVSFIVDAQPEAFPIMDDYVCDDASNDGETVFILSLYNTEILGGQSPSTFEVLYYASAEDAQDGINELSNNHINTSNPQEIFARIQNNQNADCFDVTSFEIGLYVLPIANEIADVNVCDIDNDSEEEITLSNYNNDIVNGQTNTSVSYHISQTDANNNLNALESIYLLDANLVQIYARLESTTSSDCYTTSSFALILREQPEIDLEPVYYICDTTPIDLSIQGGYDEYIWSTGDTAAAITIDTPGGYSVIATNYYGDFSCSETFNFQVIQSGIATISEIIVTDFTQNDNRIEVVVEGFGDYEYSIDGSNWQDENVFENLVLQAEYIVYIRDKNGCGTITEAAYLLFAPKFFTPNSDGYHDTWNIINFNRESNGTTHIFDRYGKLITSLRQGSSGWDGVFNGQPMPSNSYWYRFERGNGQVYLGYFSLIRRRN